jgi:inosine/xanthosine triphosphatase
MKRIAVGSRNPVKIKAVSSVVARVWPEAEVVGVKVSSRVRAMPMSEAECIAGARERAAAARELLDADLGLGLEGGVQPLDGHLFLMGWVAVVDRCGRETLGSGARIPLPPRVAAAVEAGQELGPVMDRLTGREKTNRAEGAVGILTRGLVTRQHSFEVSVAYALAPWLNPEWYS